MSTQKQCPKCGEKNPAEAVMCWACYTSLSGGAMAPAGAAVAGGAALSAPVDSGEKKKVEPKQLAIIGVGLLIALGVGATQLLGGSEEDDPGIISMPPPPSREPQPPPSPSGGVAPVTLGPAPDMPKGADAPVKFPYSMIAAPNARYSAATVAIVPTESGVTEGQAKGLATFCHRHLKKVKDFKRVEIFVFNDAQAAQEFAAYQNDQKGAPLQDYTSPRLMGVWPKALTRYLAEGDKAVYSSPQKNPTSFWKKTTT